jgi:hypothetical protein
MLILLGFNYPVKTGFFILYGKSWKKGRYILGLILFFWFVDANGYINIFK